MAVINMYGMTRSGSWVPMLVDDDGGLSEPSAPLKWTYAAASGGIIDTTVTALKAAAGIGLVNLLTDLQIVNKHASVDTEVVVLDGATVIWRGWFAHGGLDAKPIHFTQPLTSSPNNALNVQCVTTGTATYVNAQGYQSSSSDQISNLYQAPGIGGGADLLFDENGATILDESSVAIAA